MIDRALFAKADIERDDIDTCGMHVGQLPEKFRLTAAQRHAGMIVPDETADDPVEGARPLKRWKSGGSHDVTSCDYRSEEHTSELQSLMRISYAVFCLHN